MNWLLINRPPRLGTRYLIANSNTEVYSDIIWYEAPPRSVHVLAPDMAPEGVRRRVFGLRQAGRVCERVVVPRETTELPDRTPPLSY